MSLELLQSLALAELPVSVRDPANLDRLRVLHAAGMVVAQITHPGEDMQHAMVGAVTDKGRLALLGHTTEGMTAEHVRHKVGKRAKPAM